MLFYLIFHLTLFIGEGIFLVLWNEINHKLVYRSHEEDEWLRKKKKIK
jgi:hypothetical protein